MHTTTSQRIPPDHPPPGLSCTTLVAHACSTLVAHVCSAPCPHIPGVKSAAAKCFSQMPSLWPARPRHMPPQLSPSPCPGPLPPTCPSLTFPGGLYRPAHPSLLPPWHCRATCSGAASLPVHYPRLVCLLHTPSHWSHPDYFGASILCNRPAAEPPLLAPCALSPCPAPCTLACGALPIFAPLAFHANVCLQNSVLTNMAGCLRCSEALVAVPADSEARYRGRKCCGTGGLTDGRATVCM